MKTIKYNISICKKAYELLQIVYRLDNSLILITCINSIVKAVNPYIFYYGLGFIIDALINENFRLGLLSIICLPVIMAIIKTIISLTNNCIERKRQLLYTSYKVNLHCKFLELDYNVAEKIETQERLSRINSLVDMYGGLEELVFEVGKIIESLFSIGISSFFILSLLIRLSVFKGIMLIEKIIIIGIVLTAIILYIFWILKKTKQYVIKSKKSINNHGYNERVLNYFLDHIYLDNSMIYDIKLFNMESLASAKFDEFLNASSKDYEKERIDSIHLHLSIGIVDSIYGLSLFIVLIRQIYMGIISIGAFTQYYNYFLNLTGMISSFITEWGNLDKLCSRMQEYKIFMELNNKSQNETGCILEKIHEICFHNVSYKYPGTDKLALKNINCSFKTGNNIAIVGKNGAGKSTLIKLICGLYEPTTGYITVDGINIKSLKESGRNLFGTVFQECAVFPFSIAENISCDMEYEKDRVEKCLEKVGIKDKILDLPQKIDTPMSNLESKGIGFSGGEKQKLVIARSMYRNNYCYILDEPASALDVISENELYEAFAKLTKDRLGILVSHRMSGCTLCDLIVVINNGEILQIGQHNELLKNCDLYQKLWNAQAKYYFS